MCQMIFLGENNVKLYEIEFYWVYLVLRYSSDSNSIVYMLPYVTFRQRCIHIDIALKMNTRRLLIRTEATTSNTFTNTVDAG